jgi:hypothetical protein
MIDLNHDLSTLSMNGLYQLLKMGDVLVRINQGHIGKSSSLSHDACVLRGDVTHSPFDSFHVIGNMPIIDKPILPCKVGRHGRHDDPIS